MLWYEDQRILDHEDGHADELSGGNLSQYALWVVAIAFAGFLAITSARMFYDLLS